MSSDRPDDRPTALIVDDDPLFSQALQRLLGSFDYLAVLASTAEQGLEQLDQRPFDLLLLDLHLPGMKGLAMLTHLEVYHPSLPIVVISGTSSVDDVVGVLRRGVVDFIRKPLDPRLLRAALDRVTERRSAGQMFEILTAEERAALLAPSDPSEAAGPPLDPDAVVLLLVEDQAAYREAFGQALAEPGLEIIEAPSGLHALQILGQRRVDIVISDQVMPGMAGTALLETVRQRWPAAGRVLLTGYPGADVFMEAVNRGRIHKALAKQLPVQRLISEIQELVNEQLAARLAG